MPSSFEGSEIFVASPEKILLLINNFESYKEFLPGCLESSKLSDKVSIAQSKGPFLDFYALWSLEVINENQTKVKFKTTFTLPFTLSIITTQSLIDKIGHKFINAFAIQLSK
jgi:ribosome-associated toxin RatA of RatAB toxin-antitoxin module